MKKIISLALVAALLLSLFSVSAFAASGEEPQPTVGPTEDSYIYGGARLGFYDLATYRTRYIVNHNYNEEGGLIIDNDVMPGATYDRESNTLTIEDVHQKSSQLFIWYMGDDFTLNVMGENELGAICVYNYYGFYSTSLNIVGNGVLTVNEELVDNIAIAMQADGDESTMHLDIADSVTLNLYSAEGEDGEQPQPVVALSPTAITPAQVGAITVGGTAAPEAQYKQLAGEDSDYVPVVVVEDRDSDVSHGLQVKSKSDPDGVYSVGIMEGAYFVSRYIYVEELGAWAIDPSFAQPPYSGHRYKKAEFEAEYDYVYGQAPTLIRFIPEYRLDSLGEEGIKMIKDGEPDAVYIGQPTGAIWDWDDTHPYSGNYEIHRAVWDDVKAVYVEDTTFEEIDLVAAELEENGFHTVVDTVDKNLELTVWTSEDPEDTSRFDITCPVMNRKSDPDMLYVQLGTYTSGDEAGVVVYKVHYNPETDEHYIMYNSYSEPECFYVTNESIESGEGDFSYATETATEPVWMHYLPADYRIDWDLTSAVELKKNGEPDAVYAYRHWTHHMEDDTEREEYGLIKLQYSDAFGCYVEDTDFDEVEFYDLSYLDNNGYQVVMSEQPLEYVTKGSVYYTDYPIYTDNDGGTYYVDYQNNVYSYTDKDIITIGGEDFYDGIPMPEISVDDLNDTVHDTLSDNYSYYIPGTEYHHVAEVQEYVEYPLWVNGEQVNSDRLRIPCGDGIAIYDPAKKTLTLDNAEITKGADKDWTYSGVLSQMDGLTVVVKGNCTITETRGDGIGTYNNESYQVGDVIYPAPYDLTVTGDGTLTITESDTLYGYGLYCTGNLVLDSVKLNITSGATGVWASDLAIRDTEADIHCTSRFSGIVVNRGDFDFENSTVTAKSDNGAGLLLGSDQTPSALTVSSGELSLSGKLGVQGIVDKSVVTVNGGKLSVEGSEKAFDESFLADGAKNIVMGEGIGVISGAIDGKSVVISAAAADTYTVSGNFTGYLNTAGITIELLQDGVQQYSASYQDDSGSYSLTGVAAGDYTLRVSKKDHVTRDYTITVSGDTTQDVKICPLGDISGDGKITTKDYAMANAHAMKKTILTGYPLACGDVLKQDGKITTADAARINAAAMKVSPLW